MMQPSRHLKGGSFDDSGTNVNSGLFVAVLIVVAVVFYTIAKVITYAKKSRQQWEDVDRSKLKTWDDDEWK